MLIVDPTTMAISMTRGDTGIFNIDLKDGEGEPYTPVEGDSLRFAMTKKIGDEVLIQKDIPMDTLILKLVPSDTKELKFGKYVYDIQFTSVSGDVSTIILSDIELTKEVV